MTDEVTPDPAPYALTQQHLAALEKAIRAEGYDILVDPESGEIKLRKLSDGGE